MVAIDWTSLAAIVTMISVVGGAGYVWLRSRLSGVFALRVDHVKLGDRVNAMETRMAQMPRHEDIAALSNRIGLLETGVAVANTKMDGIQAGLARIERVTGLLLEHHIKEPAT